MAINEVVVSIQLMAKQFINTAKNVTQSTQQMADSMAGMATMATMPSDEFMQMNKVLQETGLQMNNLGARFMNRFRIMTQGLKGFRMELLGVMFFGMQMSMVFGGMLRPAADAFGIFELWGTTMMVLFLPIMEALYPYLLSFMEWLMELPQPVKIVLGVFAVLGLIIGKLMFILSSLGVGIGAIFDTMIPKMIVKVIGFFGKLFKFVGSIFKGIFNAGTITVTLLILSIIGLWKSFQENFNNIHAWAEVTWEGLKSMFSGVVNFLKENFQLFVSLFTGDLDGMLNHFIGIIDSIKEFWDGMISFNIGLIVTLGTGVLRVFKDIGESVDEWLGGFLSKAVQFGKDLVESIQKGLKSVGYKIKDTILDFVPDSVMNFFSKEADNDGRIDTANDFLMRPGQRPLKINPNDTVVGFKGNNPLGGGGITINQTNTISGTLMTDIERAIRESNTKILDDIRRLSGA